MSLEAQWALFQAVMSKDEDRVVESLGALDDEDLNFQVKLESGHLIGCLHLVAKYGMLQALNAMIAKGVNLWQTDGLGQNPLHYAQGLGTNEGHPALVAVLFKAEPGLCAWGTSKGVTPIHMAVYQRDLTSLELFLSAGIDLNKVVDHAGDTPLHWAARNNCFDEATLLLQHGAKANVLNGKNLKPSSLCPIFGADPLEMLLKQKESSLFELTAMLADDTFALKPGDLPDILHSQFQKAVSFTQGLKLQQSQNQVIIDANQQQVLAKLRELRM